jgi:hypothetical protein
VKADGHVKNIFKYILFDMHDIQIIRKNISLSIKKPLKNVLFYPIIDQPKLENFYLLI